MRKVNTNQIELTTYTILEAQVKPAGLVGTRLELFDASRPSRVQQDAIRAAPVLQEAMNRMCPPLKISLCSQEEAMTSCSRRMSQLVRSLCNWNLKANRESSPSWRPDIPGQDLKLERGTTN